MNMKTVRKSFAKNTMYNKFFCGKNIALCEIFLMIRFETFREKLFDFSQNFVKQSIDYLGWNHDMFRERDQAPKSSLELVNFFFFPTNNDTNQLFNQ